MEPKRNLFLAFFLSLAALNLAVAGDADILSDFLPPPDGSNATSAFFTFTDMRAVIGAKPPTAFKVVKGSMTEFPALNRQSMSYAVLHYPAGSVNPPHTHPRGAELLFLLGGRLEVGFVDTANKLFSQTLEAGDIFVFPKGMVHYQYNRDNNNNSALAVSAFGSASVGTVSIPSTAFNTSIFDGVLAKSFKTDVVTIRKLKGGLAH